MNGTNLCVGEIAARDLAPNYGLLEAVRIACRRLRSAAARTSNKAAVEALIAEIHGNAASVRGDDLKCFYEGLERELPVLLKEAGSAWNRRPLAEQPLSRTTSATAMLKGDEE